MSDKQVGATIEQVTNEQVWEANVTEDPNAQVSHKHDGGANIEQVPNEK